MHHSSGGIFDFGERDVAGLQFFHNRAGQDASLDESR